MQVRSATVADAEAIVEIYNRAVLQTKATLDLTPRTLAEQRRWITDRSGGLKAIVAEQDHLILGFASLSFYRDRPGYRASVEDSIYVHHDRQREGVGSALLGELVSTATAHGFHTIIARISEPPNGSVYLHKKFGFEMVGVERQVGRKFGEWLDVAIMQLLLTADGMQNAP